MSNAKFRSWNKEDQCFYYFYNGGYFTESGEVAKRWRFDWDNAKSYIGINYRDGSEIYEGDMVRANLIEEGNLCIGEIVFDMSMSFYGLRNDAGVTPLFKLFNYEKINKEKP